MEERQTELQNMLRKGQIREVGQLYRQAAGLPPWSVASIAPYVIPVILEWEAAQAADGRFTRDGRWRRNHIVAREPPGPIEQELRAHIASLTQAKEEAERRAEEWRLTSEQDRAQLESPMVCKCGKVCWELYCECGQQVR